MARCIPSPRREGHLCLEISAAFTGHPGLAHLVGQSRAAFEHAAEYRGCIGNSDRGTLFLTHLDLLPLEKLPHLVRLLCEHQVMRVGATAPEPVDVRLVVSLDISEPSFSLHPEIAALTRSFERVHIPALTDHPEDIPELVGIERGAGRRERRRSRARPGRRGASRRQAARRPSARSAWRTRPCSTATSGTLCRWCR